MGSLYGRYYKKIRKFVNEKYAKNEEIYASDFVSELNIPYDAAYSVLVSMEQNKEIQGRRR